MVHKNILLHDDQVFLTTGKPVHKFICGDMNRCIHLLCLNSYLDESLFILKHIAALTVEQVKHAVHEVTIILLSSEFLGCHRKYKMDWVWDGKECG